jgi:hypothetical protein
VYACYFTFNWCFLTGAVYLVRTVVAIESAQEAASQSQQINIVVGLPVVVVVVESTKQAPQVKLD